MADALQNLLEQEKAYADKLKELRQSILAQEVSHLDSVLVAFNTPHTTRELVNILQTSEPYLQGTRKLQVTFLIEVLNSAEASLQKEAQVIEKRLSPVQEAVEPKA